MNAKVQHWQFITFLVQALIRSNCRLSEHTAYTSLQFPVNTISDIHMYTHALYNTHKYNIIYIKNKQTKQQHTKLSFSRITFFSKTCLSPVFPMVRERCSTSTENVLLKSIYIWDFSKQILSKIWNLEEFWALIKLWDQ